MILVVAAILTSAVEPSLPQVAKMQPVSAEAEDTTIVINPAAERLQLLQA
jgi:hypothetical protein